MKDGNTRRYLIAKNKPSARIILKMVKKGQTGDDVFFESQKSAVRRIRQMPISQQKQFSIFEVK